MNMALTGATVRVGKAISAYIQLLNANRDAQDAEQSLQRHERNMGEADRAEWERAKQEIDSIYAQSFMAGRTSFRVRLEDDNARCTAEFGSGRCMGHVGHAGFHVRADGQEWEDEGE